MQFVVDYASPSAFTSSRTATELDLRADGRRPVRLHAVVKPAHVLPVRTALRALGELVWSDDTWIDEALAPFVLDPVVTVHPDRIFLEAFSQDQSAYGVVIVDRGTLEPEGEVVTGTTNVDFTAWLWGALGEMRSSRRTWLRIGAAGVAVETEGSGGRFEPKVDVPDAWVRGFLQLQAAAALPGTRLVVKPVDLLSAIRFLRYSKAKISPRALRYEMPPGRDAQLVIEPFEHVVPLRGAAHGRAQHHTVRTWGRRRLRLIEPLLPYASEVRVYLKGRAMPSFYAVALPGVTFVLGLTGWTGQSFTRSAAFDLASGLLPPAPEAAALTLRALQEMHVVRLADLPLEAGAAERALAAWCRRGRAIYDVEQRAFRHRELFAEPLTEAQMAELFPPDPRAAEARRLQEEGLVRVLSSVVEENRIVRELKTPTGPVVREIVHRDRRIVGSMPGIERTEVVVGDTGRVVFGRCTCAFFLENLLSRGPCAHMVALRDAGVA